MSTCCTVCVRGYPADLPPERVSDKLMIHFLRARNGGGEISSIEFPPESPGCAMVTFEDATVTQQVLKAKKHVLTVNGNDYPLEVTASATELNPNEAEDPFPGHLYRGGRFEAFLPDNAEGRRLTVLLHKAFERGLTFRIRTCGLEERVTWGPIPHKTSMEGGKARNGYPDSQYLQQVSLKLKELNIE